jgi:urease accessory protein
MQTASNICLQEGWAASLRLRFVSDEDRDTILAERQHKGPLVVQKPLYPEGRNVCHVILLHPPGGVAGGDSLAVEVVAGAGSHALLTTPGAGKWYKGAGRSASQTLQYRVEQDAVLEWLPQESILFDGADVHWQTRVELEAGACYMGWEIVCFGRTASGEKFNRGGLSQTTEIFSQGKRIWGEYAVLEGGDVFLSSLSGLANRTVSGTFLLAGYLVSDALLSLLRTIDPLDDPASMAGITRVGNMVAIRYLGNSSESAKKYFVAVWSVLRLAVTGRDANPPRIWNT